MVTTKLILLSFTLIFGTISAVVNENPVQEASDQPLPQIQNQESDDADIILGDGTEPLVQNLDSADAVTQVATVKPCIYFCIQGYHCENGGCVPDIKVNKCAVIRCRSGYRCVNGRCIKNPRPIPIPRPHPKPLPFAEDQTRI